MSELHERIAYLRKGLGLTQEEFTDAVSSVLRSQGHPPVTRGAIGNWERAGRGIDLKNMRAIVEVSGASLDWLANDVGEPPSEAALRRMAAQLGLVAPAFGVGSTGLPTGSIMVAGQAAGATLDDGVAIMFDQSPVGELPMLPGLNGLRDVYGLEVTGTSMMDQFKPGDPIYVSPHTPIHRGDPMIVIEHKSRNGNPLAFIKLMVQDRKDSVVARQLNPPLEIEFPKRNGLSTHRVLTWREALGYNGIEPAPQLAPPTRVRRGPKR